MSDNVEEKAAEISKLQSAFNSGGTWTTFVASKCCAALYAATMKGNVRGGNQMFKARGKSRAFKSSEPKSAIQDESEVKRPELGKPSTSASETLTFNFLIRPVETSMDMQPRSLPTYRYTGLFIIPSGISELDCATTKSDTAERSISISRESLQVFFSTRDLGVLPGSNARG